MAFLKKNKSKTSSTDIWARPEMPIIFRAEIMPGKNREERTFRIREVLENGRVLLHGFAGEHRETEFEPVNFNRNVS